MDNTSELSPRERILLAVIDCIEAVGVNNLTTRAIARAAGTNIASINYYFRTKDRLVAEAMEMATSHMLEDIQALLQDETRELLERIADALGYLVDGAYNFPGIATAALYEGLVEKKTEAPGAQAIRQVFESMLQQVTSSYPAVDPDKVRLALYQAVTAILFTMLSPDFFQSSLPYDLSIEETRQRFVHSLVAVLKSVLVG